jgi:hypothetical protein
MGQPARLKQRRKSKEQTWVWLRRRKDHILAKGAPAPVVFVRQVHQLAWLGLAIFTVTCSKIEVLSAAWLNDVTPRPM